MWHDLEIKVFPSYKCAEACIAGVTAYDCVQSDAQLPRSEKSSWSSNIASAIALLVECECRRRSLSKRCALKQTTYSW
jgi:hypothetical protein